MSYNIRTHSYVVGGLGVTGQACVRFLLENGASVKAFDTRLLNPAQCNAMELPIDIASSPLSTHYFDGVDTLILSPGLSPDIPEAQLACRAGVEIIGDVELFARINDKPCVGITGSNGKTTVTLLLTHILNACGVKAIEAGNVGRPVLETLNANADVVVLELSSFQLETTSSLRLQGASILNLSDDHLDRHGTLADYAQAKQRIFMHCDTSIVWRDGNVAPAKALANTIEYGLTETDTGFGLTGSQITFNADVVLDTQDITLVGTHNILNVMAALGLCYVLGVDVKRAASAVSSFVSAPHRCIEIATCNGVRYIDDSKATNVGATIAAIEGLAPVVAGDIILIAGGDAKGADLSALAPHFAQHVSAVIALGKDRDAFVPLHPSTHLVGTMHDAVNEASRIAKQGDVVLLSPACASIDMFSNYIERADVFASAVREVVAA